MTFIQCIVQTRKKTQILHRIRLKQFALNAPLEDKYKEGKLQSDEEIVIPQADLYTISWEADFEYELFEPREDKWPGPSTCLPNDPASSGVDYYDVAEDERSSVGEEKCSSEKRNENDVTEKEKRPRPANSWDATSPLNEPPNVAQNGNDVATDLESDGRKNEETEKHSSPRGGKYNLRPNPNPNFTEEYRHFFFCGYWGTESNFPLSFTFEALRRLPLECELDREADRLEEAGLETRTIDLYVVWRAL